MSTNILVTSETPFETTIIGVKRIVLDNDEIKTLPSAAVELVAAPGVGKIIFPLFSFLKTDFSAGTYNDKTDSSLVMQINNAYYSSPLYNWEAALGMIAKTGLVISGCQFSIPGGSFGSAILSSLTTGDLQLLENQPLKLEDSYNGIPNYTGGNAANTLKVTVYYIIVDF